MPAGLRRYYGKGHWHFITFRCYRRLPLLKTVRACDIFVKELGNPVIRGLVKHPRDWQWSSWGFYQGGVAGLVAIDAEE